MLKNTMLCLILLPLPIAVEAYTQGNCIYEGAVEGWRVKYYAINVAGKSCESLTEAELENTSNWNRVSFSYSYAINGRWGDSSPAILGRRKDCFGIEYEVYIKLKESDTYTFCAIADDGVEIFVDGVRYPFKSPSYQDCFTVKGEEECTTDPISLSAGYHYLLVRYYESTSSASLVLGIQSGGECKYPWVPQNTIRPGGVVEQYYSSAYPGGFTLKEREAKALDINHNWGYGAPSGVPVDLFAARFITNLMISKPGYYRFCFQYNDGIRVYLNGSPAYEDWTQHSSVVEYSFPEMAFTSGLHELVIEFFEGFDDAVLKVGYGPDCDGDASTFRSVPDNMYALPAVRCIRKSTIGCTYSSYVKASTFILILSPVLVLFILKKKRSGG